MPAPALRAAAATANPLAIRGEVRGRQVASTAYCEGMLRTVGKIDGAVWVGLTYAALLVVLTHALHPMPVAGPEADLYVERVEGLGHGVRSFDGFHPVHGILLASLVRWLGGLDAFDAMRAIAALGGGVLVGATWWFARRFGSRRVAIAATALVALHPGVLLLGMQASPDELATGFGVVVLGMAARARQSLRQRDVFWFALCFGFAVGLRFTNAAFAPAGLCIMWGNGRLRNAGWLVLGTALGFAPHALVSWLEWGSPLYSISWRNMNLKLGGLDATLLYDESVGPLAFLREHGAAVALAGIRDVGDQFVSGLGSLLTAGAGRALAVPITQAVTIALVALAWRHGARGMMTVACFLGYLGFVCTTFLPIERVLAPLVPLAAIALAALLEAPLRWLRFVGATACCVALGAQCLQLPPRFAAFVALHPEAEVAAMRELLRDVRVESAASTYSNMNRYVDAPTGFVDVLPIGREDGDPGGAAIAHLRRYAVRTGANAFVVGRRTSPRLFEALAATAWPAEFDPRRVGEDVLVIVREGVRDDGRAGEPWFQVVEVEPRRWSAGSLSIRIELAAAAPIERVQQVEVRLDTATAKGPVVALPQTGERTWQLIWPLRPAPGSWFVQPRLQLRDGGYVLAPRVALEVQ